MDHDIYCADLEQELSHALLVELLAYVALSEALASSLMLTWMQLPICVSREMVGATSMLC